MNPLEYNKQSVSQRTNATNLRTFERNIPSGILQPYLDARPCSTKYTTLSVIDPRKVIKTPLIQRATFNPQQTFNPGNDTAPWAGYASKVNLESELRNQVYALQSSSQSIYVPGSSSSLYNVKWENKKIMEQPFNDLFKTQQFNSFNPNPYSETIGYEIFNNATRQQLKDVNLDVKPKVDVKPK